MALFHVITIFSVDTFALWVSSFCGRFVGETGIDGHLDYLLGLALITLITLKTKAQPGMGITRE